jgi:hypothetical protein
VLVVCQHQLHMPSMSLRRLPARNITRITLAEAERVALAVMAVVVAARRVKCPIPRVQLLRFPPHQNHFPPRQNHFPPVTLISPRGSTRSSNAKGMATPPRMPPSRKRTTRASRSLITLAVEGVAVSGLRAAPAVRKKRN